MKTVLFVPGFRSTPSDYTLLLEMIRKKGYNVRPIQIDWYQTTIEDWLEQAQKVYEEYKSEDVILAGHSFGAVTVFLLAAVKNPYALWLFSLSGRFAEDIPTLPQRRIDNLGSERVKAFSQIRFKDTVPKIFCKTLLFFGSSERKENPEIIVRTYETHARLGQSMVVEAENAGHEPEEPAYLRAIARSI